MKHESFLRLSILIFFIGYIQALQAEESRMQNGTGDKTNAEAFHVVPNPLKVRINDDLALSKDQLTGTLIYKNPTNSREAAYFNKTNDAIAWQILFDGKRIPRVKPGHTNIKPPPLTDDNFQKLKPGEKYLEVFKLDLKKYQMLEGTHQYQLLFADNHVLPSIEAKVFKDYKKLAYNSGTNSNTVTFTYTKPSKEGKDKSNPPSPPVATPDKLNDAGDLNNLAPPRLPLGTQVSSLRSCPESGIYECSADAQGVTEHRLFIQKGRPMPSAFITEAKPGISGVFGGKEERQIETTWTLMAYE